MCRLPGLLTIAAVCLSLAVAVALGVAPAAERAPTAAPATRTVARGDGPAFELTPAALFTGTASPVARQRGQERAFTGGRTVAAAEERTRRFGGGFELTPNRTAPELAMMVEVGEPAAKLRR